MLTLKEENYRNSILNMAPMGMNIRGLSPEFTVIFGAREKVDN